jgi:hypothetical protein
MLDHLDELARTTAHLVSILSTYQQGKPPPPIARTEISTVMPNPPASQWLSTAIKTLQPRTQGKVQDLYDRHVLESAKAHRASCESTLDKLASFQDLDGVSDQQMELQVYQMFLRGHFSRVRRAEDAIIDWLAAQKAKFRPEQSSSSFGVVSHIYPDAAMLVPPYLLGILLIPIGYRLRPRIRLSAQRCAQ